MNLAYVYKSHVPSDLNGINRFINAIYKLKKRNMIMAKRRGVYVKKLADDSDSVHGADDSRQK